MSEQWYYEQHQAAHGPISRAQLKQLVGQGAIELSCLVWRDGMDQWTSAAAAGFGEVPALPTPPPPPFPKIPAPPPLAPAIAAPVALNSRTVRRPASPAANVPLFVGGGVLALVAAVAIGWVAHALSNPSEERPQIAAAAPTPAATSTPPAKARPIEAARVQSPPAAPVIPSPATVEPNPPLVASEPATTEPAVARPPVSVAAVPIAPETPPTSSPSPPFPQTAAKPASPSASQADPAPEPKTLYQEIDVQRAPKFSILGAETVQDLQYQMLSELNVGVPDDKGVRKIEQYVRETRLLKSDDLSRDMFDQSLRDLRGCQFTYEVNRRGDIAQWKAGPPDGLKAAKIKRKEAVGFMVTSVMDEDGWKEMAQLSFFVPEEQTSGSQSWVRQMSHDFGALGSWSGETRFTPKQQQSGVLQVDYTHHMTYKPPGKDVGALPFTVLNAMFKPEIAGGTFHYDTQAGRVKQLQERFWVKGELSTELLGQAATVQVEEDQLITVRILDQNPWEQ